MSRGFLVVKSGKSARRSGNSCCETTENRSHNCISFFEFIYNKNNSDITSTNRHQQHQMTVRGSTVATRSKIPLLFHCSALDTLNE